LSHNLPVVDTVVELERGREAYVRRAWRSAYGSLSAADRASPLGAEDLELLATAAYMLGRDDDCLSVFERAHNAYLDRGDALRAVRCAFWTGINLALHGELARASGWFGRAERLLERQGDDCVERGYLLIPIVLRHKAVGDHDAAQATAAEAVEIGERFRDRDLVALTVQEQGHALVRLGRVEEGLRLVDEAMVAVIRGELSPIVTGLVYCNTIARCQEVYELRRAREWTGALTRWCEQQPDMVAHTGVCLVHRAEIMELGGAWPDALEEAQRAVERFAAGMSHQRDMGYALYRQGEIHRLQGAFEAAEAAYREASRCGREPQPGLALLRLAQGEPDTAAAAIRRVVEETRQPLARAGLLPAYVEIMLAVGELEAARTACRELEEIAERQGSEVLRALHAQARGAVALAEGDARAALLSLRDAQRLWQELETPYESARTRALVGMACRALGDAEAAALELGAARGIFEQLGAGRDVTRIDSLTAAGPGSISAHGLTEREMEVLRLVAAGKSNRQIAAELVISDHTVRRHLQNIFAKLGVSSRAAATAFAFRHDLV
jgi:DNA-binding CsgD family transcriptional regulator